MSMAYMTVKGQGGRVCETLILDVFDFTFPRGVGHRLCSKEPGIRT